MAKLGRKPTYQSDAEKPVLVSLRVPRDVYEQVERQLKINPRMTLTEFILEGIQLRLETPADPRDIILSDDNTVRQELQEMIRTQVQAEIGKLHNFMASAFDVLQLAPTPEASAEPAVKLLHDSNTILQKREELLTEHAHEQAGIPSFDTTKYRLGKLCKGRHEWGTSGQSLRTIKGGGNCPECQQEWQRKKRQERRQQSVSLRT